MIVCSLSRFIFILHMRIYAGFLIRELKEYWRVALLISTLVHPIDIGDTEDEHLQLCKRRDLFNTLENSIIKLGELTLSFHSCYICSSVSLNTSSLRHINFSRLQFEKFGKL